MTLQHKLNTTENALLAECKAQQLSLEQLAQGLKQLYYLAQKPTLDKLAATVLEWETHEGTILDTPEQIAQLCRTLIKECKEDTL